MSDLVTIITPVYNSETSLPQTIESVLNQTYENWEIVLVDDGSTDSSWRIIERYKDDSRFKLIRLEENGGSANARNKGIDISHGKYIAFLDSDDIWLPEKLEQQISFMEKNNYSFTFSAYYIMEECGFQTTKVIWVPSRVDYTTLLKNTIIGCLTVVVRREVFNEIRMPEISGAQDIATWLKILKRGKIAYGLNEPLAYYRKRKMSINISDYVRISKKMWYVYRNLEKLPIHKSLYYYANYAFRAFVKRI